MKSKCQKKCLIHKRSYLLLEVLIALALVTLCLFPLMKPVAFIKREEVKKERQYQRERAAKFAFNELKVDLYENKIPWEVLEKGDQTITALEHYDRKNAKERYLLLKVKVENFYFPLLVKKKFL